jgi:hypothetical protein
MRPPYTTSTSSRFPSALNPKNPANREDMGTKSVQSVKLLSPEASDEAGSMLVVTSGIVWK